jgi:hypothetical protein
MKTIDGKDLRVVFKGYRDNHLGKVVRESGTFTKWYDKAAEMVFAGVSKSETIDTLAPWGCDSTISNGVVAGANQAAILLKNLDA